MIIRRPASPPLAMVIIFFVVIVAASSSSSASAATTEADALIQLKSSLPNGNAVLTNWVAGGNPCAASPARWTGVLCDATAGAVVGLQLENLGLTGTLAGLGNLAAGLPNFHSLSLMNNSFGGGVPNLAAAMQGRALRSIYLAGNNLTGEIAGDAFAGMRTLRRVDLSSNRLSGEIPASLAGLTKLVELQLGDNEFSGEIPDMAAATDLAVADFSNNNLSGAIPAGLSKLGAAAFAGNQALCGPPLAACKAQQTTAKPTSPSPSPPPPPPPTTTTPTPTAGAASSPKKKRSMSIVAAVIVITIGVTLALVGAAFGFRHRRRAAAAAASAAPPHRGTRADKAAPPAFQVEKLDSADSVEPNKKPTPAAAVAAAEQHDAGSLVFVTAADRPDRRFELQDLLKSSAEVLGGGVLGSSYKAVLMNGGPAVVVKRFKEMNAVAREEFQEHMRRLGRLSHPNLLPLVAYYYRKEEKLLVTDFVAGGSLAANLHGKNREAAGGAGGSTLDWPARLKVVKGVARGLAYLYEELPMLSLAHGHLKSSNVLLDSSTMEPLMTDYALLQVISPSAASRHMVAYKAPENAGRAGGAVVSNKSDVWSLGILILELLTGKHPTHGSGSVGRGGGGGDLASWVNSVVREEWTGEVFDGQMGGTRSCEGEMLQLLQIGLACCERSREKRWEMAEAIRKIGEIRERGPSVAGGVAGGGAGGMDDENYSYMSDGEGYYSSKAATEDFSFSIKK